MSVSNRMRCMRPVFRFLPWITCFGNVRRFTTNDGQPRNKVQSRVPCHEQRPSNDGPTRRLVCTRVFIALKNTTAHKRTVQAEKKKSHNNDTAFDA